MHRDDLEPEPTGRRPGALVEVEVGGRRYPLRSVPQCQTCQSAYRLEIETALAEGKSYLSIARALEGREDPNGAAIPKRDSIRGHVDKGHLPLGPTTERALIERRSKEIGRDLETHQESLVDYATANELVIQRGFERVARGELKPTMGDLLSAIRNQHAISQVTEDGLDSSAWQEALLAYMDIAVRFIPMDRLNAYGQELAQHPILRAMMTGAPLALEGEVVEDDSVS